MRRFKSIYIIIPLIILGFSLLVEPAHAIDWGDAGTVVGIGAGIATGGFLGIGIALFSFFAGFFGDVVDAVAEWVIKLAVNFLSLLIGTITDLLLRIATGLVRGALQINELIATSPTVVEGFNIVLSVANIGLVVAIVAAAFMVMLRRGKAGQFLIRFIVIALLINLSFSIVTNLLIKPVNEITGILVDATNFDSNSFGSIFTPDVDAGLLGSQYNSPDSDSTGWLASLVVGFFSVLFMAAFAALGTLALFSFAIMLYIRYVALSFLIILMPIAMLAWIFPNLKIPGGNPWTQWSAQFTRWLLFAPIVMFFFFLSVRLVSLDNLVGDLTSETEPMYRALAAVGNMAMVLGFLYGGLLVANKMSITGSKWATDIAKKTSGKLKGWATAKGKLYGWQAASAPARSDLGKKATGWMQQKTGLKFAGRALNTLGAKGEQAVTKGAQADIKTLSQNTDRLKQALPTLSGARLAEAMHVLRQKNALPSKEEVEKLLLKDNGAVKKTFQSLGRLGDYEDIERASSTSIEVAEATRVYESSGKTQNDLNALEQVIKDFNARAYTSLKDIEKMSTKAFANTDQSSTGYKVAQSQLKDILDRMPEGAATLSRKAKANEYKTIQSMFDKYMKDFEERNLPEEMWGVKKETKEKINWLTTFADQETAARARRLYPAHSRSMTGTTLPFSGGSAPAAPATP